ncbi:hypothetical protein Nmel_017665 [Mimus melanotis]
MLRVSYVQVNIKAPKVLLPAPDPNAISSPLVSPAHPEPVTPSHSRTGILGRTTLRCSGFLVSNPGCTGSKRSCTSSFLLWILRHRNLPLDFIFLSKSGWVCAVVRQRADVNVSTLTLNFALYKCELRILTVFSNFSISVVHKGRGV